MKRSILAFVLGLLGWIVAASLLNRGLRLALAGYAAAEPAMAFTLPMMVARLALAALASFTGGAIVGALLRPGARVAWLLGLVLVIAFLPVHVALWRAFPVWYHLTFLASLVPCVVIGSRVTGTGHPDPPR